MSDDFAISCADALDFLRALPEGSVDLLLTDPPYGTTDCKWDSVAPSWGELWPLLWRALKPSGVAVIFSQMPAAFDVYDAARKQFRHVIIWHKTQPAGVFNANRAPMRAHELALVFSHGQPAYNRISIPEQAGTPYYRDGCRTANVYGRQKPRTPSESVNGERALQDVIRCGLDADERHLHPTRKPRRLLRYLIRAYSQPGDLVLDPFCGSGGTAEACKIEGRRFTGCDMSAEYAALARQRVENTCPPLPLDFAAPADTAGQPDLF